MKEKEKERERERESKREMTARESEGEKYRRDNERGGGVEEVQLNSNLNADLKFIPM